MFRKRSNDEKYFNNSEPRQYRGYVYCGTFAYEAANRIASMTRAEHEDLLRPYIYRSPFGGRTEMGSRNSAGEIESIKIDRVFTEGGYVKNPVFGLRGEEVIASHFVDPALSSRVEELAAIRHKRKRDREDETELGHITRYQIKPEERVHVVKEDEKFIGRNTMMEQKALRQKIGHLFEIVSSNQFLEKVGEVGLKPNPFVGSSPYFPKSNPSEMPQIKGAEGIIAAINTNLPMTNRINKASFDGNICRVEIYLGEITGQKVDKFFQENGIIPTKNIIDLSHNLAADIDPALRRMDQYTIEIPRERFSDFEEKMAITDVEGKLKPKEQFYAANKADLFYPQPSAKILITQSEQIAAKQNVKI